jgi:hypothetical protein
VLQLPSLKRVLPLVAVPRAAQVQAQQVALALVPVQQQVVYL